MPLTPTPGTDAQNAGMPLVPGTGLASDLEEYINQTRDFIAQRTSAVQPIAKGGTGATSAGDARTALDVPAKGDVFAKGQTYDRTTVDNAFTQRDAAIGQRASQAGLDAVYLGGLSSQVYERNLTGSRRAAWIQSDGVLGYAASTERYKKNVRPFEVTDEQVAQLTVVSYQYRAAVAVDDRTEIGLIAERLVDAGLSWAVFFNDDGQCEGINYEMIGVALLPAVQRLMTRVAALEARE